MSNGKLSVGWLYVFVAVAVVSLVTGIVSLFYQEYFIAGCMGVVFGAQMINILKWKK